MINYAIKDIKNSEEVLMIVQDLKDPKYFSDYNNNPKELNTEEARSEVNKAILNVILWQYIARETRLVSNMNRIYGIIWRKFTLGI